VVTKARDAIAEGEYRWAATLLNHAVFADGANMEARELLAEVYVHLAFQAEAGTWRNIYLAGAQELRAEAPALRTQPIRPEVLGAATTSMVLDVAAVRVNPEHALTRFAINIDLTDRGEQHLVTVRNGVLVHEAGVHEADAGATVRLARPELLLTLFGLQPAADRIASGAIQIEGDASLYEALCGMIEAPVANFNVVLP
jgi:alkyl sulfatase BDS1-like metallo-beta-lactamase superfamily hydrolase